MASSTPVWLAAGCAACLAWMAYPSPNPSAASAFLSSSWCQIKDGGSDPDEGWTCIVSTTTPPSERAIVVWVECRGGEGPAVACTARPETVRQLAVDAVDVRSKVVRVEWDGKGSRLRLTGPGMGRLTMARVDDTPVRAVCEEYATTAADAHAASSVLRLRRLVADQDWAKLRLQAGR